MSAAAVTAEDRRTGARRRTLLRGRICHGPDATFSIDCSIKNLTDGGAMVGVPASAELPQTFVLMHVNEGVAYEARLAWRRGDLAGLALGSPFDLKGPVAPEHKALRAIWLALAPC